MAVCQLCRDEKVLIKAHIIPKSFYHFGGKRDNSGRLITNVVGRYPQKVPIGIHDDSIVCLDCEGRFARCDDYAAHLFLTAWDKFEIGRDRSGQPSAYCLAAYDYALLKKFFITVLWRAAVSKQSVFNKVDLGPRESVLRDAILRDQVGDKNFFGVVLQAFDTPDVGILDPHMERYGQLRFCRFYFGRVVAYFKVDRRPFVGPFDSVALAPGQPLVIIQKNFLESAERALMARLVAEDAERVPRGK